ncbi:cysteine/glutathione ABC transporter permease/ATP-binding protein CydD [Erwinia sp. OLTSP20]|uniref:heme ABC transporter permease/ATP-binding protein CydD n=1 Tax=unclassified Erwinia TaxID=2622719 RepID=UPI000C176F4E|nr:MULTISPECIES: cysteine/glutathione ABC transporter permease/ATP-binding protein CydD [unclassified Erwinia]PIJ51302.1 cysteine/glutathione ABC transporter permease/ATP-binding protein CydD [Erwinia sp. OAMSP11]PIJ74087.1 cysteine/glutathione ABC transporter permease/ATP-binding protein CydD [Erwinia sp. OLSSP12]PIJ81193.1 cysteine/glutathione ABC transporter permease/ATP-binding protein CydD [Erwinia sp. OLCASP19]PIJ86050.1 cysteine/glutathione ABC transporter permease/ATP-binding protein Cy
MNKTRQQQLTRWLRQQTAPANRWLRISSLLGVISALILVGQAWLLATLLQALISDQIPRGKLTAHFLLLITCFVLRAFLHLAREQAGFRCGQSVRRALRRQVLDRLAAAGPAWIQGKPAGSWATLLLEQIEEMHDYYARYLPQMMLAALIPAFILIAIFPINWAAALILLATAPLIPFFMALVGMGAADTNRRNFQALSRLSGQFLDRLRGLDTLRLFHRAGAEKIAIGQSTEQFRQRTMEVLRLAFLSSAVLEFFASLSIAIVAVYFGFSYLGQFHFGSYDTGVTLFAGFLALILAPEFFQPLRDLGTFYHAKAQAAGAADTLEQFLSQSPASPQPEGTHLLPAGNPLQIEAQNLFIHSATGATLAGPLNFQINAGDRIAIVGLSGSGKTSLFNVLMGFLPYQGSLTLNGHELRDIAPTSWQQQLAWLGQNPHLPAPDIRENIVTTPLPDPCRIQQVLEQAGVSEFIDRLPAGLDTPIDEQASGLSVGQAQRIALARTLLKPSLLLLLDEPAASLDALSERLVSQCLLAASHQQTTLLITHQLEQLENWDTIWVMNDGEIVQQGNKQTLLQQPGIFASLLNQRMSEVS